jgi:hypothetical protein
MAAAKKGRTWRTELEVIGLRFRWKKDGRAALARMAAKADIGGIRLVREPDNKWDDNAIMVLLPERLMSGAQLGYLHRQTAALLAPGFDSGKYEVVSAKLTDLSAEDDYNTGTLDVLFRDRPVPAKRKKPATKGKVTTA